MDIVHVIDIVQVLDIVNFVHVRRMDQTQSAALPITLQKSARVRSQDDGPDVLADIRIEEWTGTKGAYLETPPRQVDSVGVGAAHSCLDAGRCTKIDADPTAVEVVTAALLNGRVAVVGKYLGERHDRQS